MQQETYTLLVNEASKGTKDYGRGQWAKRDFHSPREIFDAQMAGYSLAANCEGCRKTNDWFKDSSILFFDIDGSGRDIDYWTKQLRGAALSIVPSNSHGRQKEGHAGTNYLHVMFLFSRPLSMAEMIAHYRVFKPLFKGEDDIAVDANCPTQICGGGCQRQETWADARYFGNVTEPFAVPIEEDIAKAQRLVQNSRAYSRRENRKDERAGRFPRHQLNPANAWVDELPKLSSTKNLGKEVSEKFLTNTYEERFEEGQRAGHRNLLRPIIADDRWDVYGVAELKPEEDVIRLPWRTVRNKNGEYKRKMHVWRDGERRKKRMQALMVQMRLNSHDTATADELVTNACGLIVNAFDSSDGELNISNLNDFAEWVMDQPFGSLHPNSKGRQRRILRKDYEREMCLTTQQRLALSSPKYQAIIEAMSLCLKRNKDILAYARTIVPDTKMGSVKRCKALLSKITRPASCVRYITPDLP